MREMMTYDPNDDLCIYWFLGTIGGNRHVKEVRKQT